MLDRHTENACVRDPDSARDDHHPYEDDSHVDRQPHRYPLRRFHSLAPFKPRHMVDQSGAGRGDVGHTAVRVVAVVVPFGPRRELTTTAILLTIWAVWSSQRQPGLNLRREPTLSDERPFRGARHGSRSKTPSLGPADRNRLCLGRRVRCAGRPHVPGQPQRPAVDRGAAVEVSVASATRGLNARHSRAHYGDPAF